MKKLFVLITFANFISFFNVLPAQTKIQINFIHCVNDSPAIFNKLIYVNNAGNKYMLKDLQYFISDVTLYTKEGISAALQSSDNIHYVDVAVPSSLIWHLSLKSDVEKFNSISFRFGIIKEKNKSFLFKNPPANLMAWPEMLGGGYHYMKLNLKYMDTSGQLSNFNCHLGLGITENKSNFIDNSFVVNLALPSNFILDQANENTISIQMNIDQWFNAVNKIDMNKYDGIMDNEQAMKQFCENGSKAFVLKTVQ
jgi:hypothetical protein